MSIRTSVLVIVDTLAEIAQVESSAPVVFCLETGRFVVKNGNWTNVSESEIAAKVSNNDPRLTDARAALAHTHAPGEVTGFAAALLAKENAIVAGLVTQYWRGDKTFQALDKSAVGLSSVDNTADAGKPVSVAQAAAIALKQDLLTSIEAPEMQRIFSSPLPATAAFVLLTGVGYFVYLGRTVQPITPKFIEFHVSTIGAGAQTAEVGLFSSPTAPSKSALVLTKLVATGAVDALTSTGVKRNTSAFSQQVAAGVHLWAGIRTAMATTQPALWGLGLDMAQGMIQSKAAVGVLTGLTNTTAAIIAAGTGVGAPNLRVTLD